MDGPGRQALTLYVAHIVLGMGVMEAMGWVDGDVTPRGLFWGSLVFARWPCFTQGSGHGAFGVVRSKH